MISDLEDEIPDAKMDVASPLSPDRVTFAAISGLSAAATKAKLFADQEEREVQRLAATIINHQVLSFFVVLFLSVLSYKFVMVMFKSG